MAGRAGAVRGGPALGERRATASDRRVAIDVVVEGGRARVRGRCGRAAGVSLILLTTPFDPLMVGWFALRAGVTTTVLGEALARRLPSRWVRFAWLVALFGAMIGCVGASIRL